MLIGAAAFFIYSLVCCRLMIRQRFRATPVAIIALVPWLVVALDGWTCFSAHGDESLPIRSGVRPRRTCWICGDCVEISAAARHWNSAFAGTITCL
jgi:hypothetical protein